MTFRVALVGGRGYTGSELLGLLAGHQRLELAVASSGSQAGAAIRTACPTWPDRDACFVSLRPADVAHHDADAWVLALPNGHAAPWARAIRGAHPGSVIVDLSADHRFDPRWCYGLPERNRDQIREAKDISNPGCYATGTQLGLLPALPRVTGTPVVFGVSGYSGAGKAPSPKNDPDRLADNLVPYTLSGHVHEREVSRQLGLDVRFMPHVAAFFRGISLTLAMELNEPATEASLLAEYQAFYSGEPRVRVAADIPEVQSVKGSPDVLIGGFAVDARDARRLSLVCVLDNLAKGAASQALQNINLALGLEENEGIAS